MLDFLLVFGIMLSCIALFCIFFSFIAFKKRKRKKKLKIQKQCVCLCILVLMYLGWPLK